MRKSGRLERIEVLSRRRDRFDEPAQQGVSQSAANFLDFFETFLPPLGAGLCSRVTRVASDDTGVKIDETETLTLSAPPWIRLKCDRSRRAI